MKAIKSTAILLCLALLSLLISQSALAGVVLPPAPGGGGTEIAAFTVFYNANGAEAGAVPESVSAASGATVTIAGNVGALTKTGYVFSGWNTTAEGTGASYYANSSLLMPENAVVLYAQWTKREIVFIPENWPLKDSNYNVAYSTSDGKGTIIPTSYKYDPENVILYTTPMEGTYDAKYNFVGFEDIVESYWASEFVWYLSARNVINGKRPDTFAPEENITRAEFVKMLVCLTPGIDFDEIAPVSFPDVREGQWFTPYVSWAVSNRIADGYTNGDFGPNDPISREQMCKMISNYTRLIEYDMGQVNQPKIFSDQNEISSWAEAHVSALQQSGLITGDGDDFLPKALSTRAVAATITCRLLMGILNAMDNPTAIALG